MAAVEKGWWWLAALIVISSLLAVVYVWRLIEVCYFRESSQKMNEATESPLSMLIPAWVFVFACIYFGLDASTTVGTAAIAAESLLESMR
jgi:multicomponent Na+:H+ antiporter subunit D